MLVVLVRGDVEVATWRIVSGRQDLSMVDVLARTQLAARRLGCSVRLHEPSLELCELLDLVGLADVLTA